MIKLELPVTVPATKGLLDVCVELLDGYVANTRPTKCDSLTRMHAFLVTRWGEYIAAGGNPEQISRFALPRTPPELKKDSKATDGDMLYACYASGRGADRQIVRAASRASVQRCPYCGIRLRPKPLGGAHDRDHALPRSLFPEFSLLVVNLLVTCGDCNDTKKAMVLDDQGRWLFVHPYFDAFLGTTLVSARVVAGAPASPPVVTFEPSLANLSQDDADRVRRHLATLGVLARMEMEAMHELQLIIHAQSHSGATPGEIASVFAKLASERLLESANDPLGIALRAVAGSQHVAAFLR